MDGREGEEDLFTIITDGTLRVGPNDGGDQDDGSQYLNDSGQGMEEEEQLQGSDVEAETSNDDCDEQALVKAGEPTASKKTKKSKRGPAKEMAAGEHLIIESVFHNGEPAAPKTAATKFRNQCGVIVRDLIPISVQEWSKPEKEEDRPGVTFVADRAKNTLFDKLMTHFTLPPCDNEEQANEMLKKVKHWALKKMAEAFNAYKKRLWKEYQTKKRAPIFKGPLEKQRQHWPSFLAYKESELGKERSAKNKANAAKKLYHHTMGPGGYRTALPKFDKLEADLRAQGITPATHDFPLRSRNWLLGHGAKFDAKGDLVVDKKIATPFAALVKVFEEVKEGKFKPDREKDELTEALGNPEHTGWTRGWGGYPWSTGFTAEDSLYPYRSRERGKKRKEAEVAYRFGELEASIQRQQQQIDELRGLRSQQQDPTFDGGPSQRRSSVASTEVPADDAAVHVMDITRMIDDAAAPMEAVDAIKEKTSCELHVSVSNVSMKVADGYALPCVDGATCHSRPIPPGYARVGVDDVHPSWRVLRLDISGGDGVETLGEAVNNIILWKKKDIVFPKPPSPPAPPSPRSSPPPPPPPSPRGNPPPPPPPTRSPHLDAMDLSSSSPSRSPLPQPTPPPTKSRGEKRKGGTTAASKSSPKKKAAQTKKPKPPPEVLPYDRTDEQNDAWVAADTKRQMSMWGKKPASPPKEPIDPAVRKHFKDLLDMPSQVQLNLKNDYERGLVKSHSKAVKKGNTIPQLGMQKKQSVSPLKVLPAAQKPSEKIDMDEVKRFARDCGMTVEQVLSGRDGSFPIAEKAWTYQPGESLVRPELLGSLSTLMRQLHQWYLKAAKKGLHTLMVKVREEDFFRDDSICIYLADLWYLYNLDALDKSIVSTYCL